MLSKLNSYLFCSAEKETKTLQMFVGKKIVTPNKFLWYAIKHDIKNQQKKSHKIKVSHNQPVNFNFDISVAVQMWTS